MSPDLSLPVTCPPMGAFENYSMDNAAFALYTLLNSEWITSTDVPPLVRLPDRYNFTGQPRRAVLDAHVALDKDITPRDDNPDVEGDLHWYPSAFIVVTDVDWATRGLLFVYLDDRDDEGEGLDAMCRSLEKFFFRAQDAYPFLGSLYMSAIYGTFYLCFAAFPIVLRENRGWSAGIGGIGFTGVLVGLFVGILIICWDNTRYVRIYRANYSTAPPECRLPAVIAGGVAIVVGLA